MKETHHSRILQDFDVITAVSQSDLSPEFLHVSGFEDGELIYKLYMYEHKEVALAVLEKVSMFIGVGRSA